MENREENNTDFAFCCRFLVALPRNGLANRGYACLMVKNRLHRILRAATHAYLPCEAGGIDNVCCNHLARTINRVLKRVRTFAMQGLADDPVCGIVLIAKN